MKSSTKGPLAGSIELYLAHKRSLGKQLAKVEPMLFLLVTTCSLKTSRNSVRSPRRTSTRS